MKSFVLSLFVLLASLCHPQLTTAQHKKAAIVVQNGDTAIYVPEHARTIFKHDTLRMLVIVHDTVTNRTIEKYERDIEPVYMKVDVTALHDTVYSKPVPKTELGIYGMADFQAALVAPSIKIPLSYFDLWIFMGAWYKGDTHLAYFTAGASAFAKF